MGWSMYSMLAYSLKLCGFKVGTVALLLAKLQGPFSYNLHSVLGRKFSGKGEGIPGIAQPWKNILVHR
jgi:hypothetical protein